MPKEIKYNHPIKEVFKKERGLMSTFARKLGVTPSNVYSRISGTRQIHYETKKEYTKALNAITGRHYTIDDLFNDTEESTRPSE